MRLPAAGEHLLSELAARFEADMPGLAAGVRARVESRVALTPLAVDPDLAERRLPWKLGSVHTVAFESERLRKVVLSEVRLWPVVEGFALTLLPRHGVAAPAFGADIMLLPVRLSANADVYGMPERTRGLLAPLRESFLRLDGGAGPAWAQPICAGEGLHAKVSPRLVGEAYGAFTGALGAYLDALAAAPSSTDGADARDDGGQAAFFRLFHANGPRRGPLRRIFGDAWAERYSRLVFE